MRNVWIIARRELRSYFDSPVAYIVVSVFLLVVGWMYFSAVFIDGEASLRRFFQPSLFSPAFLLTIMIPALTMRLIAEERKSGTIEMLSTLPIRDWDVVLGKFLGATLLITIALAMTFMYPLTIAGVGPLDWGPVIAGYVGMFLFSASLVAIGLLCSTLTDNQIVAFIIAFLVSALLYFIYFLQPFVPAFAALFEVLSISYHLEALARGVIDSRNVLYYVTLTAGALFLAERSVARQHA